MIRVSRTLASLGPIYIHGESVIHAVSRKPIRKIKLAYVCDDDSVRKSINIVKKGIEDFCQVTEVTYSNPLVVKTEYGVAEITFLCKGSNTIEQTLKKFAARQHFTINGLLLPLNFKGRKDIIDYTNGVFDIKARRIEIPDASEVIVRNPLLMLEAILLAQNLGFSISRNLASIIRVNAGLVNNLKTKSIRRFMEEVLLFDKPSKTLSLLARLGLLAHILPELNMCRGVKQNKTYHVYDVYTHCVHTCDHTKKDLVLRWSALLHDVGKVPTKKVDKGRITFYKHNVASSILAKQCLRRFRYPKAFIDTVTKLVRMHMYYFTNDVTDAAIMRFINEANITQEDLKDLPNFPLFLLRQADRLGNKKTEPISQSQIDLERRIVKVYAKYKGIDPLLENLGLTNELLTSIFKITSDELEQIKSNITYVDSFGDALLQFGLEVIKNKGLLLK